MSNLLMSNNIKAIIVEDEPLAARRLRELLERQQPPVTVVGEAESVEEAVALLRAGPAPDLLLLDIHLADGLSFAIFEQVTVTCPVIFTTAYDQYALQAFKVNSVDYLLKPIDEAELAAALQKLRQRQPASAPGLDSALVQQLLQQLQPPAARYKSQFVVRVGEHLKVVPVEQVAYFCSFEKATLLQTGENRRFVVEYTLDQLEAMLDPQVFFRLNRAYLVQTSAIRDIIHYTNSRLQTILHPPGPDNATILVSRDRVNAFKAWLDR